MANGPADSKLVATLSNRIVTRVQSILANNPNSAVFIGRPIAVSVLRSENVGDAELTEIVKRQIRIDYPIADEVREVMGSNIQGDYVVVTKAERADISRSAILVTVERSPAPPR